MTGDADNSSAADRLRFTNAIEAAGFCSVAIAQAVKDCPLRVSEMVSCSLDLPGSATYAQAAEVVMVKHRNAAMTRQAQG